MPDEWSPEMAGPFQQWERQEISDDIEAFGYYATLGLIDPKMPAEAWVLGGGGGAWLGWNRATIAATWAVRPTLVGFLIGSARSIGFAMLITGAVGWAIDPHDVREGGLAETSSVSFSTATAVHRGWELENF
jgi:hypothetical protein